MKHLKIFIEEFAGGAMGAGTPGNTMGMGNPVPVGVIDGEPGTEPLVGAKVLKAKVLKQHKKCKKCKKCNKCDER